MNVSHPQPPVRPDILSKRLFKLERCGKYEEGLAETREIWPDTTALPNVAGLDSRDAAELLLRCGALFGFLGHIKQLPNAQEKSRNVLTEARNRFIDIYDVEKIAECENYIALAYWRSGELNEAETFVETALSHDLPSTNEVRLYSIVTMTILHNASKRYNETIDLVEENEYDFMRCGDAFLLGSMSTNIGIALKNLGRLDESLERYKEARMYHSKSGHKTYLATVDNNLANIYKARRKYDLAHGASDSAVRLFGKLKDRTHQGFSVDTKACIYIAEGRYQEAIETADKALEILERSENTAFRIETMMTKVKALVFLGDISEAAFCLSQAVDLALVQTGEKSARELTRQFESALNERAAVRQDEGEKTPAPPAPAEEKDEPDADGLQLVLPPSLAHHTDFQGVWINGSHLEKAGLTDGSLAVVVNGPVKRGDLVAVTGIDTELVSCGLYDTEFGMVSLEGLDDSDPKLFDEQDIKILGRIVGVCNSGKDADGKMMVEEVDVSNQTNDSMIQ